MKKTLMVLGLLASIGSGLAQSGPAVYQQNCAFCHSDNGQGRVGAFPPLAGHSPALIALEQGRSQLIATLLYGMQGPIKAKGNTYNGVMPSFAQLSNEQLANVLNYILTAWNNDRSLPANFQPVTPAEVAAARATRLTPQQVGANRARLNVP
ncbi:MAG: cytochrome c [Meiothermus sp.]|nr:cytochrome c [Meiothermus sp.]